MSIIYPEPPEVLIKLKDTKGDINAVAEIVSNHESLAKEVLATINAPYFALVRQIQSAEEAVRMLGINRVVNLTTGRLLRTTLFSGEHRLFKDLWGTSLKVAVIGVLISKELKLASTDEVYAGSLFHNVGMAMLADFNEGYIKGVSTAYGHENSHISQFEEQAFGHSHADLGSQLAHNWGLAGDIVKAIKWHHSPEEAIKLIESGSEAGELLLILKLSEHIARIPGYLAKCPLDHEWEQIKEPILDQMTLTEGMFKRFELVIKKKLAEIKS
mgnify:CR=1 FL=1